MGGGVSTIELWTLGMVWEGAGGIQRHRKKRFLPSLHNDRRLGKNKLHRYQSENLSRTIQGKEPKAVDGVRVFW